VFPLAVPKLGEGICRPGPKGRQRCGGGNGSEV